MSTRRRSSAPGHIRRRGPDSWQVILEAAPDPLTGNRRRIVRTVRGTKADAERLRAQLVLDVGRGRVEARGKARLSDVIDRWLDHATPDLAPPAGTADKTPTARSKAPMRSRSSDWSVRVPTQGASRQIKFKAYGQ